MFLLTVQAPVITTEPADAAVGLEQAAEFSVMVSGQGLTYQWFGPGGVALSDQTGKIVGATSATLIIFNVRQNDIGSYQVRVSNAGGSVTSNIVALTISKCFLFLGCT